MTVRDDSDSLLKEVGELATATAQESANAANAIVAERKASAIFLDLLREAVRPAIGAIASRAIYRGEPLEAPFDRGVLLATKRQGLEALYLSVDCEFFVAATVGVSNRWIGIVSTKEVVDQRWRASSVAENLAAELEANLKGSLKTVERANLLSAKVRAVATLLAD